MSHEHLCACLCVCVFAHVCAHVCFHVNVFAFACASSFAKSLFLSVCVLSFFLFLVRFRPFFLPCLCEFFFVDVCICGGMSPLLCIFLLSLLSCIFLSAHASPIGAHECSPLSCRNGDVIVHWCTPGGQGGGNGGGGGNPTHPVDRRPANSAVAAAASAPAGGRGKRIVHLGGRGSATSVTNSATLTSPQPVSSGPPRMTPRGGSTRGGGGIPRGGTPSRGRFVRGRGGVRGRQ